MSKPQHQHQLLTSDVLLSRAQAAVTVHGQKLRHPDAKLGDVLYVADKMLEELRTNELSPKQYYELNLQVLENLYFLQSWFTLRVASGSGGGEEALVDLYQRVQYSTHAVPRMYLMLTVGACYVQTHKSRNGGRDVMRDMLEMCKSVQNPSRGLFVRNYLSQVVKDHVALLGGPTEQADFLLQNFAEMAKLWMRMVKKSEEGAQQLGQLVGQNLTRLSEFSLDIYAQSILPRFAAICTSSDAEYAQEYLLDVLVNSFPLSFHFATLDAFLQLVAGCVPAVGQAVLCSVLARFQQQEEEGGDMALVFAKFMHLFAQKQVGGGQLLVKLIELFDLDQDKRVQLFDLGSELTFANPNDLVRVIELAFAKPDDLARVIAHDSVYKLFSQLPSDLQQTVSTSLVLPKVVQSSIQLGTKPLVLALFRYLPKDTLQANAGLAVSQLAFRFENESNPAELLLVLDCLRVKLEELYGEEEFTLALQLPLLFRYMQVSRQVPKDQARGVLQTVHSALTVFAEQHMTALTRVKVIKLFLQLAMQADALGEEDSVSYECMVSAFTLFEEEPDSKTRVHLVPVLIGTVQQLTSYSKENLDIMQTKVALYSAQLLKKQDQARCLAQSSALFWNSTNSRNGKRALECLQRAGKTCPKDMLIQVDLLNLYVALYQASADKVKAAHLNELIQHIRGLGDENAIGNSSVEAYFQRTLLHLRGLAETSPQRFAEFATLQATRQAEDFMQ